MITGFASSRRRLGRLGTVCLLAGALVAGCTDGGVVPGNDAPDLGGAEPVATDRQAETDGGEGAAVDGTVTNRADFDAVSDMAVVGETLAVRSQDSLWIGTTEELSDGGRSIDIDAACEQLTAAQEYFVLACGDSVELISADSEDVTTTTPEVDFGVTAATRMNNGNIVLASSETNDIVIIDEKGEEVSSFSAADPSDELIHVESQSHGEQLVRTWRENSTIQNLDWDDERGGGTLRVGVGVGTIAAGDDGIVLAADTRGNQLAVYTAMDVIRLHQTVPVPTGPWAVAWDGQRDLAWSASTQDGVAVAFDVSSGVAQQRTQVSTVRDAQNFVVTESGTLVFASATGDGVQYISEVDN